MLVVDDLVKSYPARDGAGAVRALGGVSLAVGEGEFVALLGPSGCGKTTTLQCIAGLETPDAGRIAIANRTVFSSAERVLVPANRRGLGMVFQSYAIWPHMTVAENVAFPLVHGGGRPDRGEVARRVAEALALVELAGYGDRPAPHLSGGQQQRVALARALVHEPALLLLDEPLSNLDARLRDAMRVELRQLIKSLGITTVFVTHDQVEAMSMADRVALMRDGALVQVGTPRDVYLHPRTAFAADFMGRSNLVPCRVERREGDGAVVATAFGPVAVADAGGLAAGASAVLVLRPHAVALHADGAPGRIAGTVSRLTFLGDQVEAEVDLGGVGIGVTVNSYDGLAAGQAVAVEIPPGRCALVPPDAAPAPAA